MAGWESLMESPVKVKFSRVVLVLGEISSLVLDRVRQGLQDVESYSWVDSPSQISFTSPIFSTGTAYVVSDPNEETMLAIENSIRSGSTSDFVILIPGDHVDRVPKKTMEYLKRRAQQSKTYFTINPPKTDAARDKMVSYMITYLSVSRESAYQICANNYYSPGRIYLIAKQLLLITGGDILPSSKTESIVRELLGNENPEVAVQRILSGTPIDNLFTEEFTRKVVASLHRSLVYAQEVKMATLLGKPDFKDIQTYTGIPIHKIIEVSPISEALTLDELRSKERTIRNIPDQYSGDKDLISVLSRIL